MARLVGISGVLITFAVATANILAATLVWDANSPAPAGYNVYFSALPEVPLQKTNVGPATSLNLGFLAAGRTYTLFATAYAADGLESDPSISVTYSVPAAPVAPIITVQPLPVSVSVGASLALSVSATGTAPLNYQWLKNGVAITGATASSYSINSTQATDAGSYTVRVSNSAGSVLSSAATVTVVVPPTITSHPSSQSVNVGSTVTLSVVAGGTAPLGYQWLKNGSAISGATAANYTISSVQTSDAGSYSVRVSNSAGSISSSAATITVIAPPTITTRLRARALPPVQP